MSFGAQGGMSTSRGTQVSTTPFTGLLPSLFSTLTSGIKSIAGGGSTAAGTQAIVNASNQNLTTGIQGLKAAFAGSGMGKSSSLMQGISQLTQQTGTNLAANVAQFQQTGIQDQLAAIGEIIAMAQGSGTISSSSLSTFLNAGLRVG